MGWVFLHAHESGIVVGLGEAVAPLKDLLVLFILLGAGLVVTAKPVEQLFNRRRLRLDPPGIAWGSCSISWLS